MKKWPFFAIILPWMASYGSERRFVLIFSARDDFGKVSWKMDARKCINQVTPPFFDHLSESRQTPLQKRDRVFVVGDLLLGAAPSGRSPSPSPVAPHLRTVAPPPLLFSDQWSSPNGYCAEIVPTKNFLPNLTYFLSTLPRKTTPEIFSLRRAFLLQPPKGQCQNFDLQTNVIKGVLIKYRSGNQGRKHVSESAWIGVGP